MSSVTNPLCDSCNRLRLTANGQLKNYLLSSSESDFINDASFRKIYCTYNSESCTSQIESTWWYGYFRKTTRAQTTQQQ
ncbi:hypothetical protein L3X37_13700 [Sabulilitoribacter arenilitoris]|uniref:Uncharacterized protein n=1 Tax=Wocania arenilitoris TaxID=2044858 RepID=A0AAE3ES92_9FLAO|nr:hypothetical protein [Wocania arenilitoris]